MSLYKKSLCLFIIQFSFAFFMCRSSLSFSSLVVGLYRKKHIKTFAKRFFSFHPTTFSPHTLLDSTLMTMIHDTSAFFHCDYVTLYVPCSYSPFITSYENEMDHSTFFLCFYIHIQQYIHITGHCRSGRNGLWSKIKI